MTSLVRLFSRQTLSCSASVRSASYSTIVVAASGSRDLRNCSKKFLDLTSSTPSSTKKRQQYVRNFTSNSTRRSEQMSTLGNLSPAAGSTKNRKRVGRGIGSKRGGKSGKGNKGQGQHGTLPRPGFEGGQTPLILALPKRGAGKLATNIYTPLNLDRLQHWIDMGRLNPTKKITMAELYHSRCIHRIKVGVKLLAGGMQYFKTPNIDIEISRVAPAAADHVESLGGKVVTRYETALTRRAMLNPDSFWKKGKQLPRKADPLSRKDLVYYANPKYRGYLYNLYLKPQRDDGKGSSSDSLDATEQEEKKDIRLEKAIHRALAEEAKEAKEAEEAEEAEEVEQQHLASQSKVSQVNPSKTRETQAAEVV